MFGEVDPDTPLNVFYVAKSLLLENSSYFAIILDSTPERAVVFLPEHDYEVVADWLNLIFAGKLSLLDKDMLAFDVIKKYFVFADLVGSEKLKNVIMDSFQGDLRGCKLYSLHFLEKEHPALTTCSDIITEYLAYVVVTEGWKEFFRYCGTSPAWSDFMCDRDNAGIINKLFLKVDELNEEKARGTLINPMERKDCKWHEHISEETKAKCPGREVDSFEVVINGATKGSINTGVAKTNGHNVMQIAEL